MKMILRHTTHLEDWIESFYRKLNILHPHELDAEGISQLIGLKVEFLKMTSRYYNGVIILDSRLSPPEQWQEFGHELCHALRHEGNQLTMPPLFAELQEMQANIFAYKFCVPSFMLKRIQLSKVQIDLARLVASKFNVTHKFALRRLELLNRQLYKYPFHV